MIDNYSTNIHFRFWEDNNKWFGSFPIKWIYALTIEVENFKNILSNDDLNKLGYKQNSQLHELPDCA